MWDVLPAKDGEDSPAKEGKKHMIGHVVFDSFWHLCFDASQAPKVLNEAAVIPVHGCL